MLARLVDNWLTKATERSFQVPFAHMLAGEGHMVVHVTRHCGMEQGKDVISIAPDGVPCAFQLKTAPTGRITQSDWQKNISPQVGDLVCGKIVHPSVAKSVHHRAFLVTNGELAEEVCRAIDDRNRAWVDTEQGHFQLQTVTGGELRRKAELLGHDLWPEALSDVTLLLELLLDDGRGPLRRDSLVGLLDSFLPFDRDENEVRRGLATWGRSFASAGLYCNLALSPAAVANNHATLVEGWTLFLASVLGTAERFGLGRGLWANEKSIACLAIRNALDDLVAELETRADLFEGDRLPDFAVYRYRITCLAGLLAIRWLWRRWDHAPLDESDTFSEEFISAQRNSMLLWGEAALPYFLAVFWMWRRRDPTRAPDEFLGRLLAELCKTNRPGSDAALASPYHSFQELQLRGAEPFPTTFGEDFSGSSYYLEGLLHLFVRRLWKIPVKTLWPQVTRIGFEEFLIDSPWRFFRWRSKTGTTRVTLPQFTKSWPTLLAEARAAEPEHVPLVLREDAPLLLLLLVVMPFRGRPSILRWLDTRCSEITF